MKRTFLLIGSVSISQSKHINKYSSQEGINEVHYYYFNNYIFFRNLQPPLLPIIYLFNCHICLQEVHLQRFLKALTSCSSCLTKQYDTLVGTALVRITYFMCQIYFSPLTVPYLQPCCFCFDKTENCRTTRTRTTNIFT